jgi:protein TonB
VAGDGAAATSDDAPPAVRHSTRPVYPQAAHRQKIEGTVLVEILIDEQGRVARSRVIQSVPGLDEAALECIRGWTFAPARKHGKAVPTIAHVPVRFRIY